MILKGPRTLATRLDRTLQLLRYHQPSQLFYRGKSVLVRQLRRIHAPTYQPRTSTVQLRENAQPLLTKLHQRRLRLWPDRQDSASLAAISHGEFRFLNQTRNLSLDSIRGSLVSRFGARSGSQETTGASAQTANVCSTEHRVGASVGLDIDWNPVAPRLWRFHLHYHESLLELADEVGPDAAWTLVESWLGDPSNQSPYADPDAWHPFCLSMRLPNWLLLAGSGNIPDQLSENFWQSVSQQVDWLWQNPEWDLGGNHLLENLRTLAIADAVLEGDLRIDRKVLYHWIEKEIKTQVLRSGEHFERTPTYHALMLLAIMEIANAAETVGVSSPAAEAAESMAKFLGYILHPDGGIPLLGDSVFAETPVPKKLLSAFEGLEESPPHDNPVHINLDDYWVWRSAPKHQEIEKREQQAFILFDVGDAACDHLPAHAHADLLCVSASAAGERFLVDTGTFDYEDTVQRAYCRSTRAHNTACIDDRNQCDLWSRFRMGRRGHVLGKEFGTHGACRWCVAWHDAHADLGVKKTFRLVVAIDEPKDGFRWLIADWFEGRGSHQISSPLHIGPAFKVDTIDTNRSICRQNSGLLEQVFARSSSITTLAQGDYYPNFGVQVPIDRIEQSATLASYQPIVWTLSSSDDVGSPTITVKSDLCGIQWGAGVSFQIDFPN